MESIVAFLKQNKKLSLLTILSLLIQIVGTLGVPYLIGELVDKGIASGDHDLVINIGLQMLAVAFVGSLGAISGSYLTGRLSAEYGYEVRGKLYGKVQDLSIQDVESVGIPSLLTRMTNDVTNVQRSLAMFIQMILPAPIISLFAIIMTIVNSPRLALIPLVSIVLYVTVVGYLLKKGLPISGKIQTYLDQIVVKLREFFNGINMIRAFDNQEVEEEKTNQRFEIYGSSMIRVNRIFALLTPVAYLIMGLVFSSIIWFGGQLVGSGDLQVGVVTAVVEYSMQTIAYLVLAAMVVVTLPRSIASLNRIEEILEMSPEISDRQGELIPAKRVNSDIFAEFKQVQFSYNGSEPVLEDITFKMKRGHTTAIVGGTGSGKSTIAKVLLNLTTISQGTIELEGQSIVSLSQKKLRQKISYVPQKAFLFSGTIEENLRNGNQQATISELKKATEIAQAKEFIEGQKDAYQAFVAQGGTNFSGGQKQRLSIARALIKQADLYVFDDSFSALDYQTDSNLRRALREKMPDSTFLIVAQRLSTIKDADHIIVLDEGKIVGQGKHGDLLKNNQTYQEFATSQGIALNGGEINE